MTLLSQLACPIMPTSFLPRLLRFLEHVNRLLRDAANVQNNWLTYRMPGDFELLEFELPGRRSLRSASALTAE